MNDWDNEQWQRFEEALRSPEPWELADQFLIPPPNVAPLRLVAARLDEERTAARTLLDPLLVSLETFTAAKVDGDPAFHTCGVVDVLNDAARPLRNTQPQLALATATAAVTIAAKLAQVGSCTPRVLGRTYMERGWALFFVGRYREAEEALRHADVAYAEDPRATDWDRAHAALARANVYVETHRHDEASREARFAAKVFATFGDHHYSLAARVIDGHVLFLRRDYAGAAAVLDAVALEASRSGDRLHLARARQSAGNCYIELGDLAKAEDYFYTALTLWDELELDVERLRTEWSLGALSKARGDLDEAILRIDEARRAFEKLGIVNDAAITRLELAEVLLLADRPSEVPDLLRDVVVSFTSEGMMRNASMALAYLREAVEAGGIEPRLVRHVRDYLEELPIHPANLFTPLR